MKAEDFERVKHVSCNGCHFQHLRRVTCMDEGNRHLINNIFLTLGNCFGAYPYIFILKDHAKNKNDLFYKRTKPFPVTEDIPEVYSMTEIRNQFTNHRHRTTSR